ncbi:EAL domain-containing protein [Methylomonas sp. OY6]|uniref:EAL domain-containing protein n=1 Tax=Methylomonas defluvii TaxID=3045149 RepID=A0ABU4UKI8_9GAMM|nr:EAL domain-containing protein [Methylomonas sp. OY6]MDX8130013.1 EAL domain-containing protein [Methylomonas sp. OY6]
MARNEKVFGFDSLTNPISRESKLLAQKYDKPSLSNALFLMQRTDASIAVLLSIPVYTHLQSSPTRQLTGFISAVILTANLVETALKGLDSQNFSIRIDDINPATQETNLYNKNTTSDLNASYGLKIWEHQFKFCDRTWKIVISPDNHFLAVHGTALPWMTLSGGLFFSSLLSVLLLTISGKRAHVEALVDIRTAELRVAEKSARESAAQLRTVVESQPECVKVVALDGSLLQMNQAGLNMLEADNLQQLKATCLAERVLPNYRTAFAGMLQRVFSGQSVITEFEISTLKGRRRWLESHAVPMRNTTGDIIAMLSVTRDITERKRAEESQRLAARVFGEAHEGIVITNADGIIIDVNPMFCEITGYSRDEVLGQNPNILQSGNHSPDFFQGMWNSLKTHRHWQGEVWNRKKNGDLFAELLSISVLCDEQEQIIHYLGLFSDITESKQQQQLLELLAHFDPLTRIPNRTLFTDRFLQALAHSKRDQSLLAICFLDLDGFKPVNDEFGHDVGDQVLIEVADRIRQTLREADTVSRHGGDEFAVLLSDLRSIEESKLAISRIHQAILEPYLINEQTITIGVSTGITVYPLDDSDPDTLLRHADQSMYQAKLAGKNRFHLFDASQNQQEIDRHKQVNDIKTAFHGQQFCLYYQPKVNLKSGQVVGVEALIHWVHPERGLISPLLFMPIITASHLEIEVGNWVIKQAWQQLGAWHNQGLSLEVSINISGYHLLSPGFIEHLDATLATQPQLASQFFQLEILESTALDELSAVNKVIKACRDQLGVKVALDDFGTGYSSLTHLRHLPVDCVKIDQSFVRDMLGNPDDFAIVESVISLSDAFHREVVAEGVENHNQVNVLLLMGCELAQGFVIAKPMPADDIAGWTQGYQPHSSWSLLVEQNISAEKALITIFRIELRQWLNQIHACLDSTHQPGWPVMNSKKSHFGRWLKRAQQHAIYPIQILEKISKAYKELLQHGIALKHHVIKGEFETAQHYFSDLQIIHEDIDQQLLNL